MSQATELIAKQMAAGSANARVWADILYNVKAYGAKGDGVTDDTVAIQAAIDACNAASGGIVFFPPGTYRNSRPFAVYSNMIIEGAGDATILKPVDNYPATISPWLPYGIFWNNQNVSLQNVVFRDFAIDGNDANQPNVITNIQSPFYIVTKDKTVQNKNIVIQSITIHDLWQTTTAGCFAVQIENTDGVWVEDCLIYNNGRDGINVAGNSANIYITGNNIHDTQDDGIAINPGGTKQTDPTFKQIPHVRIMGNNIYNCGSRGIAILGVSDCIVDGNSIDTTVSWGILVTGDTFGDNSDVVISNNVILNASQWSAGAILNAAVVLTAGGIQVASNSYQAQDWLRITISGNTIVNPAKQAVDILTGNDTYQIKNVKICGNQIHQTQNNSIMVRENASTNKKPTYLDIADNEIFNSNIRGIAILTAMTYSVIENNTIINSGQTTDSDALLIGASVDNVIIRNNRITDDRVTKHQAFGIAVTAATTNTSIIGNTLTGNKSGTLYLGAAVSRIINNAGYNPQGWTTTTPALPVGVGVANAVTNNNPYPVRIHQTGMSGTTIVDTNGTALALGLDPTTIELFPGEKAYFATTVPTSWKWYGI